MISPALLPLSAWARRNLDNISRFSAFPSKIPGSLDTARFHLRTSNTRMPVPLFGKLPAQKGPLKSGCFLSTLFCTGINSNTLR